MTKPSVYVETSGVSYLTARPSRVLIIAAQQAMTREWWSDAPERFVLVASEGEGQKDWRYRVDNVDHRGTVSRHHGVLYVELRQSARA